MPETIIARTYAQAILAAAQDEGSEDKIKKNLVWLSGLFESDEPFRKFLVSPRIDRREKKKILLQLLEKQISPLSLNFLTLLVDKGRIELLPLIDKSYNQLYQEAQGVINVKITTSFPLEENYRKNIREALSEKFKKEIILEEETNPKILGGMIVRVGDLIINSSLLNQISQLTNQITMTKIKSEEVYEDKVR